jgi:putative ABC transport system permease protein
MTLSDQIQMACSNLGRRKMRSFLASLGVLVGTVTIVLLISLASGVRLNIHRQFESIGLDRLMIFPSGRSIFEGRGPFRLPGTSGDKKIITPADLARWKDWTGVAKITPEVRLPGSVGLELRWKDKVQAVRIGERQPRPGPPGMLSSPPVSVVGTLELPERGSIVLSLGTTKALEIASDDLPSLLGQSVEVLLRTSRGETQGFVLKVQGVSSENSTTIQVSVSDCIAMKSWWFNTSNLLETEGYDSATLQAADVSQAKALIPRIREEGYQVQSLDMFLEIANRIVVSVTIMLVMIGGVALVVASIGIANTMIMAVYERTREIGILKAIGASGGDIRRLFMIEAGSIGLAGGIMGFLVGWGLGALLNKAILLYLHYRELPIRDSFFVVTPLLALGVIFFATLIGVVAGLIPAHRASGLDPLEALRHE